MTRFLTATALTIAACMAAFVGWGCANTALFYPALFVAFIASEWAITEGQRFEQSNPTKETP